MIDILKEASRIFQSRRYTHDVLPDSLESFAKVMDLSVGDIYSSAIPSSGLLYSGSLQNGSIQGPVKFWYRQALTPSNVNSETWFFVNPPTSSMIGAQMIDPGQQVNFISPKYAASSVIANDVENNPPGYLAKVFISTNPVAPADADLVPAYKYMFDYKEGIVHFASASYASGLYVYASAYQYVGNTLDSQLVTKQLSVGSFPNGSDVYISGSTITLVGAITASGNISASISNAVSSSYSVSSSWSPIPTLVPSSSYATSASWAPTGTSIVTASTYPITASSALTASYFKEQATFLTTASLYQITSSQAISASWAPNQGATTLVTASTYQVTASWSNMALIALSANTASYFQEKATFLNTASTYPITSSWSNNSISTSYAAIPNLVPSASYVASASYYPTSVISSSYASSASWAPSGVNGTTLTTASTYQITSSWSNNAISASWAPGVGGSGTTLVTASVYQITASWSNNVVSSSYAVSASWSPGGIGGTSLTTASTYPVTSSWANNVISSSYAPTPSLLTTSDTELVLSETGDTYGAVELHLQNRNGMNGAMFKNASLDLVDFAFLPNSLVQNNIRLEHRPGSLIAPTNTRGEFQFFDPIFGGTSGTAYLVTGLSTTSILSTNVGIGTSVFDPTNPATLFISDINNTSYNLIVATGNVNNYLQFNINNVSTGTIASADIVATSDKGNESVGYIDMGINSSGYNFSAFNLIGPLDGYVYTIGSGSMGGNLALGTLSDSSIIFHTSGSMVNNERLRINSSGITSSVAISAPAFIGTASYAATASYVPGVTVAPSKAFIIAMSIAL